MSPIPRQIKREGEGIMITWSDDHVSRLSYADLRRQCPCAQCREHPPRVVSKDDPLKLIDDRPIYADSAELVGRYAIQFFWNDGHSSGIYSFQFLREICPCPECRSSNLR